MKPIGLIEHGMSQRIIKYQTVYLPKNKSARKARAFIASLLEMGKIFQFIYIS